MARMGDILYPRIRDVVEGTLATSLQPAKDITDLIAVMLNDYDEGMSRFKNEVLGIINNLKEKMAHGNN